MGQRIDSNTKELGRVKNVEHAKLLARLRWGRTPRSGREMCIDVSDQHRTYLANDGGRYRVWTWFDVTTNRYDNNGYAVQPRVLTNAMSLLGIPLPERQEHETQRH